MVLAEGLLKLTRLPSSALSEKEDVRGKKRKKDVLRKMRKKMTKSGSIFVFTSYFKKLTRDNVFY